MLIHGSSACCCLSDAVDGPDNSTEFERPIKAKFVKGNGYISSVYFHNETADARQNESLEEVISSKEAPCATAAVC